MEEAYSELLSVVFPILMPSIFWWLGMPVVELVPDGDFVCISIGDSRAIYFESLVAIILIVK